MKKIILILSVFNCCMEANAQLKNISDNNQNTLSKSDTTQASYPDGDVGWRKFLIKNLNVGIVADNGAPLGIFSGLVKFDIDTAGNISNFTAETNIGFGLEDEIIRVLKKSGKWNPAYVNGKAISCIRKQPVTCFNEDDGTSFKTKNGPFILIADDVNEISIGIKGLRNNFRATISEGTIVEKEPGIFMAYIEKPGRALIEVYNKSTNKLVTAAYFKVIEK